MKIYRSQQANSDKQQYNMISDKYMGNEIKMFQKVEHITLHNIWIRKKLERLKRFSEHSILNHHS